MLDPVESLILDLLEWLGPTPRPYAEVMDAWRTSCPRLPVWEEANERGFLARHRVPGSGEFVTVSATGRAYVRQHRSLSSDSLHEFGLSGTGGSMDPARVWG